MLQSKFEHPLHGSLKSMSAEQLQQLVVHHAGKAKLRAMTRLEICSPEYVAWVAGGSLGTAPDGLNDSWQLGCLLAHLLAGLGPFKSNFLSPYRGLQDAFKGLSDQDAYVAAARQVQEQHAQWVSFCWHSAVPCC